MDLPDHAVRMVSMSVGAPDARFPPHSHSAPVAPPRWQDPATGMATDLS